MSNQNAMKTTKELLLKFREFILKTQKEVHFDEGDIDVFIINYTTEEI